MGVDQHARPQVGELGLGTIVVSEDVTQLALHWHSDQSARESVTSRLVSLFPSALLPWVNLPMTEQPWSLLSGSQTSV